MKDDLEHMFLNYFTDTYLWLGAFNRMPDTFHKMVDLGFITWRIQHPPEEQLAARLYESFMTLPDRAKLYKITFKGLWKLFLHKRNGGLIA